MIYFDHSIANQFLKPRRQRDMGEFCNLCLFVNNVLDCYGVISYSALVLHFIIIKEE